MKVVIRIVDFVGHGPAPVKTFDAPVYLEAMDFEAHGGQGFAVFTNDKAMAKRFDNVVEALAFWQTQSKTVPLRPDGKPNRPLTASTITFENVE